MSSLFVYHVSNPQIPQKVLNHFEDIAPTLAAEGIRYERWPVDTASVARADEGDRLAACQTLLAGVEAAQGFAALELISFDNGQAQLPQEQRYQADEIRWCIAGSGLLVVHAGEYLYGLLCERQDAVYLPAGTAHWFDAGDNPSLVAVRLSRGAADEQAQPTGDDIASRFGGLEY